MNFGLLPLFNSVFPKANNYNIFTEVYCGPVPQIDNGFSIGSTNVTYRGVATYQCYAGFAFPTGQPIERISCLSDGRWERTPTCLGKKAYNSISRIYHLVA